MPAADKDTRFFIDVDVKSMRVLGFGSGDRHALLREPPKGSHHRRLFLTKGQFNKLVDEKATSSPAKTKATTSTTSRPSRRARTPRAP